VVRSRNFIPRSKLETERGGERWTLGKRRRKCVCLCVWWCVCVCVCVWERERERERVWVWVCVFVPEREWESWRGERERETVCEWLLRSLRNISMEEMWKEYYMCGTGYIDDSAENANLFFLGLGERKVSQRRGRHSQTCRNLRCLKLSVTSFSYILSNIFLYPYTH
jgi:hypothetical protein